jgi:hypothetical protein
MFLSLEVLRQGGVAAASWHHWHEIQLNPIQAPQFPFNRPEHLRAPLGLDGRCTVSARVVDGVECEYDFIDFAIDITPLMSAGDVMVMLAHHWCTYPAMDKFEFVKFQHQPGSRKIWVHLLTPLEQELAEADLAQLPWDGK